MLGKCARITTVNEYQSFATSAWGSEIRRFDQILKGDLPTARDHVDFPAASADLKLYLADRFLREFTPGVGAYCSNADDKWFFLHFARELAPNGPFFDGRRIPPLRSAVLLLAYSHWVLLSEKHDMTQEDADLAAILDSFGGRAIAAHYLVTQLEGYFRSESGCLDCDGRITSPLPASVQHLTGLKSKKLGQRINQIQDTFRIYVATNNTRLSQMLSRLESDIGVANRLERIRHPAMHGTLADTSCESLFYGFLLAMLYYHELLIRPRA